MSSDSVRGLEEERRLFYVALTRAEKRCFLTCAQNRFRYGKVEFGNPSRFLEDIDPAYIRMELIGNTDSYRWPMTYRKSVGNNHDEKPGWMQNPHPVASQFKADPMRRMVPPKQERPMPPNLSSTFIEKIETVKRLHLKPMPRINKSELTTEIADGVSDICVGSIIEHQRFGVGTVIMLEGLGENLKATVQFDNSGIKQLLMKFARYKVVKR